MFDRKKYLDSVNANGIFKNTYETRFPQTCVRNVILNHFEKSDKSPKCLFLGWDGCRADAMKYLIKSGNKKVSGANETAVYSAVAELKTNGGFYISYVGAEENDPQETGTAQGWASALCGKWMKKQWKQGIDWSVDEDYPTVLKTLALNGYTVSFSAIWPVHFDKTYKNEIEYAQKKDLSQYFYQFETDEEIFESLEERIRNGDDFIFGIFENPDLNGHDTGFDDRNYRYVSGICNLDRLSYKLFEAIKKRDTFQQEDWLVIIGSDHGGHATGHGTQNIQDRTTFPALSKPIEDVIK
ncbi:MAG: alkaline phosphatase family protein [Acutalibacteraceae bacterium]